MFVLCPHCRFLVALNPASAQSPARCPRCNERLQAAIAEAYVPENPPDADADAAADIADLAVNAAQSADAITETIAEPAAGEADVRIEAVTPAAAPERASGPPANDGKPPDTAPVRPARRGKAAPSFVRDPVAANSADTPRKWSKTSAIAALSLLLLLQLVLADRAQLAGEARWRPALSILCGMLGCTLPPWHEPSAFIVLQRDVRPHPGIPGALHVTATFRNDARWPQPWPSLLLSLSDVDGRTAGARLFVPREYLGAAPTQNTLASGHSATVAMDVLEPTPRIVAFTFDFR